MLMEDIVDKCITPWLDVNNCIRYTSGQKPYRRNETLMAYCFILYKSSKKKSTTFKLKMF